MFPLETEHSQDRGNSPCRCREGPGSAAAHWTGRWGSRGAGGEVVLR